MPPVGCGSGHLSIYQNDITLDGLSIDQGTGQGSSRARRSRLSATLIPVPAFPARVKEVPVKAKVVEDADGVFPTLEAVVTETPARLRKVLRPDIGIALIDLDRSQA
jgi:hypothetical protein